jgi:FkbM family methyltransferase
MGNFNQSLVRKILDQIRQVNKTPTFEKFLAKKTQGKQLSNFWVKLLPSIYSYKTGTLRSVERNGIRFKVDISDYVGYILYFGLAEESKDELYKAVKNGMYVFDVGSNIGDTLLNIANINTLGMNYGFEPVPFLFQSATINISMNPFTNISFYNLALSNKAEVLYYEIPKNRNSGSISMSFNGSGTTSEVKSITLDEFVENEKIPRVDLIKIDVEGFEGLVLEGAKQSIQKFKPVLFIEVVDEYLREKGFSAAKLISIIKSFDYQILDVSNRKFITSATDITNERIDILCNPILKTG